MHAVAYQSVFWYNAVADGFVSSQGGPCSFRVRRSCTCTWRAFLAMVAARMRQRLAVYRISLQL
jgi:hypothetical protein